MLESLRWRVPAFLSGLIVITTTVMTVVTDDQIESTLVRGASERAAQLAPQMAELVSRAIRSDLEDNDLLANHPAVIAFVSSRGRVSRAAATEALTPRGAGPSLPRVELWSLDGQLLWQLSAPPEAAAASAATSYPPDLAPSRAGVSAMHSAENLAYVDITSEVGDGGTPSRPLGYLRRYRRLSGSVDLRSLIGHDGTVRVSSPTGAWLDLATVSRGALSLEPTGADLEYRSQDGEVWIGARQAITGTPLSLWVGFPRASVLQPAYPFMRRMIGGAAATCLLSTGLVLLVSMRVARRVTRLTDAADAIAAGDYARRVPIGRDDEIGQLSAAFNTMVDQVTAAHSKLSAQEERTQFALIAAGIGVWESDVASGRMTCSESLALFRGLPPGGGPTSVEAFLAQIHEEDRSQMQSVLRGESVHGPFEARYRVRRTDGAIRLIEARGRTQVDTGRRLNSVLGTSVDVTERSQLEMQLRQAQKMDAVGQLAGGVAHDFNNLLTAILGHGNFALEELPEHAAVRDDIIQILKAGERAAGLTRQLLAFSRLQVMRPEAVGVNGVIRNVETLLRRLIGEQIRISLELHAADDVVKVDPGQFEQVLVNLAVNARDAMPDGGTLTVATANVVLDNTYALRDAVEPGPYLLVAVSDTGTGMTEETQSRLFEPFFTTKPEGKGTGLGLSTVYGIVKQSGGSIHVYSEPGHGTTFKVYLPGTDERAAVKPTHVELAEAPAGSERVLVVEDSPLVKDFATRMLEQLGYRVMSAASGEDAIALFEASSEGIDLIVSDVILPGMTGPELVRRILPRCPEMRVLFTSGYSRDAVMRHGVLDPGTMFIEKPYSRVTLSRKVRETLGASRS